jgi:hypothetical protein
VNDTWSKVVIYNKIKWTHFGLIIFYHSKHATRKHAHFKKCDFFLTLIIKWLVRYWFNDQYIKKKLKKNSFKKNCNMKNWLCNKMISQCLDLIMSLPLMNAFLLSTLCENLMGLQGMGVAWCQSTFISFNLSIMLMHTIMENQFFYFSYVFVWSSIIHNYLCQCQI